MGGAWHNPDAEILASLRRRPEPSSSSLVVEEEEDLYSLRAEVGAEDSNSKAGTLQVLLIRRQRR